VLLLLLVMLLLPGWRDVERGPGPLVAPRGAARGGVSHLLVCRHVGVRAGLRWKRCAGGTRGAPGRLFC